MKVSINDFNQNIISMIKNPDLSEGEDILIYDDNNELAGVIIQPKLYQFIINKINEIEDAEDSAVSYSHDSDTISLDDLLKE
ncbi:TPA: hypothetical protein KV183_003010 [Morganella morganii]|uniref:hypothetical protein n=1 Tax=Enterobacterales TaxID=91347 RepID=UPI001A21A669|nr:MULTISPECIES: hypothetical protein [Enterobacterales]MCU6211678.1 hypothetical protein [Morganella morganii]MCU6237736.1 hypothetical protein [Morganella morganii]MCU6275189.1 hypothetical protein [Morganella morganii]MCU6377542.1 hypothetical protein [Morganella morganii]MDH0353220.1 hypothetical protein [Morganella sp. GD04133]